MKFNPNDWWQEPGLRAAAMATRGTWIDVLCLMWKSPHRGVLEMPDGCAPDAQRMARILGCSVDEWKTSEAELYQLAIADKSSDGKMICRRMVRESEHGAAGARGRWGKDKDGCEDDAQRMPNACQEHALDPRDQEPKNPRSQESKSPRTKKKDFRTCADDSESSAPVKRLRRKFTEPERKTIDLNCGWFYKRYHQATGQHSPQEPKLGRSPHPMDARAALKLSGLIADRTAPAVDLLLKDWLAGRYYVAVGDTLANFVSIIGRLVPANRKDEKVNETPGSERGKHSGSGGFKPLAELLPPAEAHA